MNKDEREAYRREGEFLFIAPREPHLTVVVDLGDISLVNHRKPKYANFSPGPFGGEFRTTDKKLGQLLRERDKVDMHYQEVTCDEDLVALSKLRDIILADEGTDKVVQGRVGGEKKEPAVSQKAPASAPPPAPKAAKGPNKVPAGSAS